MMKKGRKIKVTQPTVDKKKEISQIIDKSFSEGSPSSSTITLDQEQVAQAFKSQEKDHEKEIEQLKKAIKELDENHKKAINYLKLQNQTRLDEQIDKVKRLSQKEKQLEAQIKSKDFILDGLSIKLRNFEEHINSLKTRLRQKSIQNKNLQTRYQIYPNNGRPQSSDKLPIISEKIIHKTESERVVDLHKQIQNMQYDVGLLFKKLQEKQEEYHNKYRILEEERKIEENTTVFNSSMCDKIEFNIQQIAKEEIQIYDRFIETKEQNLRLQNRIKNMVAHQEVTNKAEEKITEYVNKLEAIIFEYSAEAQKAKKAPAAKIDSGETELLNARVADLQSQLKKANSRCKELQQHESNFKMAQRARRNLQAELELEKSQNNSKNEFAKKSLEDLEKYSNQLSIAHQKIQKLENQIDAIQQKNNGKCFDYKLTSSQILIDVKPARELIIEQIQAFEKKEIRKSEVVFREDKHHHSFGNYLTESFPLLLIVQINENTLFGAYSSYFLADGKSKDTFLFTFDKNGKLKTYFKYPGKQSSKSISYSENSLVFGYNEVLLRNNSKSYEMTIATNIFGAKHYELPSKLTEFQGMINNNKISYTNMEIHKIRY